VVECVKRKWSEYVIQFKEENKDIAECMINRIKMTLGSSDENAGDGMDR
jgi:hypothetical protein